MDENGLQYTLGAGTLLGAMRNAPPGLLQWEHDVDVYVLARQASLLLLKLQAGYPPPALPRSALPCAAVLCPLPRHAAHLERSAPNGAPSPHTRRGAACRPSLSLARGLRCAHQPIACGAHGRRTARLPAGAAGTAPRCASRASSTARGGRAAASASRSSTGAAARAS